MRHHDGGGARAMSLITRTKGHVRMEWAALQELEKMVGKLTFTALKLAPGVERRDSLILIGSFRNRIAAMKRVRVRRSAHRIQLQEKSLATAPPVSLALVRRTQDANSVTSPTAV